MGKKPSDLFEKYKSNQAAPTLSIMNFKMALTELGPIGQ